MCFRVQQVVALVLLVSGFSIVVYLEHCGCIGVRYDGLKIVGIVLAMTGGLIPTLWVRRKG